MIGNPLSNMGMGNIWIGPWAIFPKYVDLTFAAFPGVGNPTILAVVIAVERFWGRGEARLIQNPIVNQVQALQISKAHILIPSSSRPYGRILKGKCH